MNEWERQKRKAEYLKKVYPPGTRIVLNSMGNDPRPIESGTRGTVLLKEPLDLGANGGIEFDEETSPNFLGYEETPRELLAENEQEKTFGMGEIKQ